MNKFKKGDVVKCIDAEVSLGGLTQGKEYIVAYATGDLLFVGGGYDEPDGWDYTRFELVKEAPKSVAFKVLTWKEWTDDISKRIAKKIEDCSNGDPYGEEFGVDDLIYAPILDKEDPRPFCEKFMLEDIYENNVVVKYWQVGQKNTYWYISGDDTTMLYHPQLP